MTGSLVDARCWCCAEPVEKRDPDPWEGRMDGYCTECATTRCDTTDSVCSRKNRPDNETDEAFLARLRRLGGNWRYSDEFIGLIVRARYPRDYSALRPRPVHELLDEDDLAVMAMDDDE